MTKKSIIPIILISVLLLLPGCGATPALNEPVEETTSEEEQISIPDSLFGYWYSIGQVMDGEQYKYTLYELIILKNQTVEMKTQDIVDYPGYGLGTLSTYEGTYRFEDDSLFMTIGDNPESTYHYSTDDTPLLWMELSDKETWMFFKTDKDKIESLQEEFDKYGSNRIESSYMGRVHFAGREEIFNSIKSSYDSQEFMDLPKTVKILSGLKYGQAKQRSDLDDDIEVFIEQLNTLIEGINGKYKGPEFEYYGNKHRHRIVIKEGNRASLTNGVGEDETGDLFCKVVNGAVAEGVVKFRTSTQKIIFNEDGSITRESQPNDLYVKE